MTRPEKKKVIGFAGGKPVTVTFPRGMEREVEDMMLEELARMSELRRLSSAEGHAHESRARAGVAAAAMKVAEDSPEDILTGMDAGCVTLGLVEAITNRDNSRIVELISLLNGSRASWTMSNLCLLMVRAGRKMENPKYSVLATDRTRG